MFTGMFFYIWAIATRGYASHPWLGRIATGGYVHRPWLDQIIADLDRREPDQCKQIAAVRRTPRFYL
jgi:hypothetical protein